MVEHSFGPFWVTAAALVSIQLAQGRSADELELLAAFFEVVANNLALLAGLLPADSLIEAAESQEAQ